MEDTKTLFEKMHTVILVQQMMIKGFVQLSVICKPCIFLYHVGSYSTCKNDTSPGKISMPQKAHLTWYCEHIQIKIKSALNSTIHQNPICTFRDYWHEQTYGQTERHVTYLCIKLHTTNTKSCRVASNVYFLHRIVLSPSAERDVLSPGQCV